MISFFVERSRWCSALRFCLPTKWTGGFGTTGSRWNEIHGSGSMHALHLSIGRCLDAGSFELDASLSTVRSCSTWGVSSSPESSLVVSSTYCALFLLFDFGRSSRYNRQRISRCWMCANARFPECSSIGNAGHSSRSQVARSDSVMTRSVI